MKKWCVLAVLAIMVSGAQLHAGHFARITIDGVFDDWAGVPVVDSDGGDNSGGPDIGDTQIANDGKYLYIRNTFPNGLMLSTYTAIDVDLDASTGFDVFSMGVIGAEAAWQNDYGFSQATGVWNSGPLGGDFLDGGHALIAPFDNGPSRELAISLANTNNGGLPTFPGSTIRLIFFTDQGAGADGLPEGFPGDSGLNGDITAVIEYTLAVPEPASLSLLGLAGLGFVARRRRMM